MLWLGEVSFGKTRFGRGCGASGVSSLSGAFATGASSCVCGAACATFGLGSGALGNSFTGRSGWGAGMLGGATSRNTRGLTCTLGGGCAGRLDGFNDSSLHGGSNGVNCLCASSISACVGWLGGKNLDWKIRQTKRRGGNVKESKRLQRSR